MNGYLFATMPIFADVSQGGSTSKPSNALDGPSNPLRVETSSKYSSENGWMNNSVVFLPPAAQGSFTTLKLRRTVDREMMGWGVDGMRRNVQSVRSVLRNVQWGL